MVRIYTTLAKCTQYVQVTYPSVAVIHRNKRLDDISIRVTTASPCLTNLNWYAPVCKGKVKASTGKSIGDITIELLSINEFLIIDF